MCSKFDLSPQLSISSLYPISKSLGRSFLAQMYHISVSYIACILRAYIHILSTTTQFSVLFSNIMCTHVINVRTIASSPNLCWSSKVVDELFFSIATTSSQVFLKRQYYWLTVYHSCLETILYSIVAATQLFYL